MRTSHHPWRRPIVIHTDTEPACTGNCYQGRACDCVPDVGDDPLCLDASVSPEMKSVMKLLFWSFVIVALIAGGALVFDAPALLAGLT